MKVNFDNIYAVLKSNCDVRSHFINIRKYTKETRCHSQHLDFIRHKMNFSVLSLEPL
jgi:hypothetical protein